MSKQWKRGNTHKKVRGQKQRSADDYEQASEQSPRTNNPKKNRQRIKNEKALLDLLATDPEAEEELITE